MLVMIGFDRLLFRQSLGQRAEEMGWSGFDGHKHERGLKQRTISNVLILGRTSQGLGFLQ